MRWNCEGANKQAAEDWSRRPVVLGVWVVTFCR
jgi:hypothetical protein